MPTLTISLAEPTLELEQPQENDVVNKNVFTVSGTASGSDGSLLQTTESNFKPGDHANTTVTSTGEVVIFPMPTLERRVGGDPVLVKGADGNFDDEAVHSSSVVKVAGSYHMWYTGNDGNNNRIGYATSPDGAVWTVQNGGNPVLDRGNANDWNSFGVMDPWVMEDSGTFEMWFTGSDGLKTRIGYATSADGVTWNQHGSEVLDLGDWNKFDEDGTSSPTVLKKDGTYHMWYVGTKDDEKKIGYATSSDGTSWTRQNSGNPVFSSGASGAFDGSAVLGGAVFELNQVYKFYYTGDAGGKRQIGLATSTDGINWQRENGGNPVFTTSSSGFDWMDVQNPCVMLDGMVERMWYSGQNSTTTSIGYATGTIQSVGGVYTSPPFEFGGNVDFGKINWTVDEPAGTGISMEVRTQQKFKSWSGWSVPTNGQELGAEDGWKFQYKIDLSSNDINSTPEFRDLTLAYYKPLDRVEVSTNDVTWSRCNGTLEWTCEVYAENGQRRISARSVDVTGDHSKLSYVNITVNGDLPQGTINIEGGNELTNSRVVELTMNATDSSGVVSMMISEDDGFAGTSWEAYQEKKTFTLSEGDGVKTVHVKYKDFYGIESEPVNDTIELDTTPPNGTITIDEGAEFTTDKEVLLSLSSSDKNGVTGMIISEDPDFSGLSPGVVYESEFYELGGGNGEKTVYVRFIDGAGNTGDYSDTIILDTTSPRGDLKINSNAAVTITRTVNLTIDGNDKNGVIEMMLSNDKNFTGAEWRSYEEHIQWDLIEGVGERTVYLKLKDSAGLISDVITDTVVFEEVEKEGVVLINEGAEYTNVTDVSLVIGMGSVGSVVDMKVSNDPGFENISWEPYSDNREWDILPGDGLKTVYVKFRTLAGIETETFKDNITLDTKAPDALVGEPQNGTRLTESVVKVRIRATDSQRMERVEVRVDGVGWEEAIQNQTDPKYWELEVDLVTKGTHEITVRATDGAGNTDLDSTSVLYKPKKKGASPFLDVLVITLALAMATLFISFRRHDR